MENQLKARFLGLYCMVLADGIVDANEIVTLYRIGREQYGLTEDEINKIIVEVGSTKPILNTMEEKISFLYQLAEIAWSDGEIDDSERSLMKKYIIECGFEESNTNEIIEFLFERAKQNVPETDVIKEITE